MRYNLCVKQQRLIIVLCLLGVLLVVSAFLFYNLVITANKTVSPTKDYEVSYNRITKNITMLQLHTGVVWYEGECYDPTFLWAPDGKSLARNISTSSGIRRAEVVDLEHSTVHTTLTKSNIQEVYKETRTKNQNNYENVEITKWLDNKHVLLEFSWPSDVPGKNIAGWCVYDFSTWTIKDFAVLE